MSTDSKIKEWVVRYLINGKAALSMNVFATSPLDAKTNFKKHLYVHHKSLMVKSGIKSFTAEEVL